MAWNLEFYRSVSEGVRTGGDKITVRAASVEQAILQAKAMMRDDTFSFGRANLCLVKTTKGALICTVFGR